MPLPSENARHFPVHPRTQQRLTQSGIQHTPSFASFRPSGTSISLCS